MPSLAKAPPVAAPVEVSRPDPVDEPDGDEDAAEVDARPRRNPARRWTIAAVAAALLLLGAFGALQYFEMPGLSAWLTRSGEFDTPLRVELPSRPQRYEQPSGNELFTVSGSIVNPSATEQRVPDMMATLLDKADRPVYSWRIVPPVRRLPPGGRADFDSAEMDVPARAEKINIAFVEPPGA